MTQEQRDDLVRRYHALPWWAKSVLRGLDILGGRRLGRHFRVFKGDPVATISERLAHSRARGERVGIIGCQLLDRYDPGHCDRAGRTERLS